jgi:D-glycero-alpha-D-manno-heptose 1-phosphate guanylyltransferase
MATVAGRPFLEWQLDALALRGLRRIILSVGFRREAIEKHFGSAYRGMDIAYSREAAPLGTGGAIAAALRLLEGPAAFVLNGDTYMRAPLHALEWPEGCAMSVLVARVDDASRYGTVALAGDRLAGFREKALGGPGLVNSGVYWLRKDALADPGLGERFSFEKDFVEPRAAALGICAVVTDERFVDIGLPESLAAAGEEIPRLAAGDRGS